MNGQPLHRVLVPVQFTASDAVSLTYVTKVCAPDTLVILLHVLPEEGGAPAGLVSRAMRHKAELHLDGFRTEVVVAKGRLSDEIVKQARAYDAELIVMTPERCGGLLALFRRNTAALVARKSVCPVLVLTMSGHVARDNRLNMSSAVTGPRARVFC